MAPYLAPVGPAIPGSKPETGANDEVFLLKKNKLEQGFVSKHFGFVWVPNATLPAQMRPTKRTS